jgi:hypothetical protein
MKKTSEEESFFKSSESYKSKRSKVVIEERYMIKNLITKKNIYNMYEGIDLMKPRYLSIYAKPVIIYSSSRPPLISPFPRKLNNNSEIRSVPPWFGLEPKKLKRLTTMWKFTKNMVPASKRCSQ